MKVKRIVIILAGLSIVGGYQSRIRADEPRRSGSENFSASQVKDVLDRETESLPKMIEKAEKKTGGKAAFACVKEWREISDKALRDPANGDESDKELREMDPSHPVGTVIVVKGDQFTQVLVCGHSGKILQTKDLGSTFSPGADESRVTTNQPRESRYTSGSDARYTSGSDEWGYAPRRWQRLTDLMKKPLRNSDTNEHIGSVKDFAIDPDAGAVLYSIVEFDNKMGHGNRYFALPLSVAKLGEDYKEIDMKYASSQVNNANGFEKSNWPNLADENWSVQVFTAFGKRPYWQGGTLGERTQTVSEKETGYHDRQPARNYMDKGRSEGQIGARYTEIRVAPRRWEKASDLIGKTVRNPDKNDDLGTLKDIVVDPDTGRILYGVLASGGFLGVGKDLFAVPWNSFDLPGDAKTINLNIDKDRLKNAEGFDKSNWPNMADPRWSANIHSYYGREEPWRRRD